VTEPGNGPPRWPDNRFCTVAPASSAEATTAPKTRPRTGPLRWFLRGGWYPFVIVLSLGILSFVPFTHAALRTRQALMWLWTVLYFGRTWPAATTTAASSTSTPLRRR
jgi:hypothetical protein